MSNRSDDRSTITMQLLYAIARFTGQNNREPYFIVMHPITWKNIIKEIAGEHSVYLQFIMPGELKFKGYDVFRSLDIEQETFKIG